MNDATRLLTIFSACCLTAVQGETPRLVKDIDPSASRRPRDVQKPVVAGTNAYFSAWSREAGQEIWITDRTSAGTRLLKDIYPGMSSSAPSALMAAGSGVFFLADDGVHGREPWTSDGTAAGTRMLGDFTPGSTSGNPGLSGTTPTRLWFHVDTSTGAAVWSSDGTAEGTIELNPPVPGSGRPFGVPRLFRAIGDTAYFVTGQADLWRSDGTVEGTQRIEHFDAPAGGVPYLSELVAANGELHFIVTVASRESLWRTDGTAGAAVNIARSPESDTWQVLSNLHVADNGRLFFIGQPEPGTEETWRSGDGTLAGSARFLSAGPPSIGQRVAVFKSDFYIGGYDPVAGSELWRSDGTVAGTTRLLDIDPGVWSSDPGELTPSGPWMYFTAQTRKNGRELWRTDGTAKGTRLVTETAKKSGSTQPEQFVADGAGNLFFLGGQLSPGNDLWYLDGAKRKARQLTTPGVLAGSGMGRIQPEWHQPETSGRVGNRYLFRADDGKSGGSLWASDGAKSTKALIKTKPLAEVTSLGPFTSFGSRTLFVSLMTNQWPQVWITNGSPGGTRPLTRFNKYTYPGNFVTNGSVAWFTSGESIYNRLWTTDGTPDGTRELLQPDGEPFNVFPSTLYLDGSTLYFAAITPSLTRELWRTDGTAAGTVKIKADFPAPNGPSSLIFSNFRQTPAGLCFTVGDLASNGIWTTDGTSQGTVPVPIDLSPSSSVLILRSLPFGDRFLFLATSNNGGGTHWWVSDGTSGGTQRLTTSSLSPGFGLVAGVEDPHAMLGEKIVFASEDVTHGRELWTSDGTPEGTFLLANLNAGVVPSYPAEFVTAGDRVYFTADDGIHGRELWVTDGTTEGTVLAADILPGATPSNPTQLRVVGGRLFFGAESLLQGYELHAIDLPAPHPSLLAASAKTTATVSHPADDRELLNLAFNLPAESSGSPALIPNTGNSGYPHVSRDQNTFRVEYLRRTDGRFRYVAKCSATLAPGSFVPMAGAETVTDIDELWQRVIIEHPLPEHAPRMFGIVEVEPR